MRRIFGLFLLLREAFGTCPPATPTDYEERNGKYYWKYNTKVTFDDAQTLCPAGYQLVEWRNQQDWETVAHYSGSGELNNDLWTGLKNTALTDCDNEDCYNTFTWLSDGSVQSYHPFSVLKGKSNEECLRVKKNQLKVEAKNCDHDSDKAKFVCEATCSANVAYTLTCPPAIPSSDVLTRNGRYYIKFDSDTVTFNEAKSVGPVGCPAGKLINSIIAIYYT